MFHPAKFDHNQCIVSAYEAKKHKSASWVIPVVAFLPVTSTVHSDQNPQWTIHIAHNSIHNANTHTNHKLLTVHHCRYFPISSLNQHSTAGVALANKYLKELGTCKADVLSRMRWKKLTCKGSAGGLLASCSLEDECVIRLSQVYWEKRHKNTLLLLLLLS